MMSRKQYTIIYILLIILALIVAFPVAFSVLLSFGDNTAIASGHYIPKSFSFINYARVFQQIPLLKYIWNSIVISVGTTVVQIIIGILAAYFFVFIDFKGKNIIFAFFMLMMMVPVETLVVSNFQTIRALNLVDTYLGLMLPNFASAFGIFFLRQTMRQIPKELKEAADVAGVGNFYFLVKVAVPLCKNSILTLLIYFFLASWNAYLWPLVATTNDTVKTAQLGLRSLTSADVLTDYSLIAAASIIVAIPTLIAIFLGQDRLQEGLSQGAIK